MASEMWIELHKKTRGGNIGLKIDISQTYDSVSWSFLMKMLENLGFNKSFCVWIYTIMSSTKLSILVNGNPKRYFQVSRCLIQGDPLSPFLFLLIKEVLISKIEDEIDKGKVKPMAFLKKGSCSSSSTLCRWHFHFYKWWSCKFKSLEENPEDIPNILWLNGECYKKQAFFGSLSKKNIIKEIMGMNEDNLPNSYLRVPIFKGRAKKKHIWNIIERLQAKLAGWKKSILSFQERVILVKSVPMSILIYNMAIY